MLALTTVLALSLAAPPASAQTDPMGGFFKFLFGGQRQPQPGQPGGPVPPGSIGGRPATYPPGAVIPPGTYPPGVAGEPVRPTRPRAPAEPRVVEQPKDPDAQVVLVLGDSQAAGLASGLQVAFADSPNVNVVSRARPSLSIVRDDEYDFLGQLPSVLQEGKFDFIVIMSGVNDRQSFYDRKTGARTDELKSDRWEGAYRARITEIAKVLQATGKPVYWVGQPPTERPTHSAFMSYINGVVRQAVEANGVTFVDVWPGFTDDDGNYTASGPDVDGKVRRLRSSDGTFFTRAGQRKLAFFVEQSIRDQLKGVVATPEPIAPEAPQAPQAPQEVILAAPPPLPPAPWKKVGPVITFGAAPAEGELELAGGPTAAPPTTARPGAQAQPQPAPAALKASDTMPGGYPITETPLYRRFVQGESIAAPSGRIDDFRWQRGLR